MSIGMASDHPGYRMKAGKRLAELKARVPLWEVALEAMHILDKQAEGEEMDAGFDGGEFSGPAHARIVEGLMEDLATKNGYTVDQLMNEVARIESLEPPEAT